MKAKNLSFQFVWNAESLRKIDASKIDYAFGMNRKTLKTL